MISHARRDTSNKNVFPFMSPPPVHHVFLVKTVEVTDVASITSYVEHFLFVFRGTVLTVTCESDLQHSLRAVYLILAQIWSTPMALSYLNHNMRLLARAEWQNSSRHNPL